MLVLVVPSWPMGQCMYWFWSGLSQSCCYRERVWIEAICDQRRGSRRKGEDEGFCHILTGGGQYLGRGGWRGVVVGKLDQE